MSKDAYYFSHDSNARNDLKVVKLRRSSGLEGYGLYWCIIEMLRESDRYELPIQDISAICFELRTNEKLFDILFECQLLFKGKKMFYSKSLKNRMLRLDKIKQKRKIAGAKGGKSKASAKQVLSNSEASKVKQSKEEQSKVNGSKEYKIPSLIDVKSYFKEKGYKEEIAEKAFNYYESYDWNDSKGKEIKNWKNKMVSVWFTTKNKLSIVAQRRLVL